MMARTSEKGIAVILTALMLTFIVGAVGLAVDVGVLYMIKARLSAAVDAAALAAGRSVNLASTVSAAQTQATANAQKFFNANFPAHYLGTTAAPTVTPTFTPATDANGNVTGVLNIQVTASVTAPTYFLRIFNIAGVPVSATGVASRRGLVMMLVLDVSISMNTPTSPTACQVMVSAARNFIQQFSPFDTVGLVTFDYTAHLAYAPSANYGDGSMDAVMAGITCQNSTNTTSALEVAYQQIQSVNLPLAQNSIVLFTDGSPNGLTADFPVRLQRDSRWGPAVSSPAPPSQSGSTYGIANSCNNNGTNGAICINMPVSCTGSGTVRGTISQSSSQNSYGGGIGGLYLAMDTDPAIVSPAGCNAGGNNVRQMIAYIPDTDVYGNSTHGVIATGPGPTVGASGPANGLVTRDFWLFQTNNQCSPDPTVQSSCINTGGLWSAHSSIGSGSNYFPSAPAPAAYYGAGYVLRPDQPNTLVAASMNTAMAEAYRIRGNSTYHVVINSIYLTGNGTDSVDREFLPVMANVPLITALPYDPLSYTPYANPAYQANQEHGLYLVTADKNQLTSLFSQLASEVLRLSK